MTIASPRAVTSTTRARLGGESLGSVGGPVVGDEHLTAEPRAGEPCDGFAHARGDGLRFVETRHQDRQIEAGLHRVGLLHERGVHRSGVDR